MRHLSKTRIVVGMIGIGVALAGTLHGQAGATQAAQPDCPQGAQPLQPFAVAPASHAALRSQRDRYDELGTRPLVTRAVLAQFDDARGPQARRECGRRVQRRTVVVYIESASATFRRRSPSLSQGVVFVSRFPDGAYRVWQVVR
jgi:hypothetical protein